MTSVTGTSIRTNTGFTLVEVMVTVAIIAVMAMAVTFVVPDNQEDELADAAEDLYQQLLYAQEYALVRHAILGVELDQQGYRFLQWQDQQWQPLDFRGLREQDWPTDVSYELDSETEALLGDNQEAIQAFFAPPEDDELADDDAEREQPEPQLWILGSGDISVFTLALASTTGMTDVVWQISSADGYSLKVGIPEDEQ
ncbi:Tfp pilus assembly protein FimT/FimU [Pseudidiomarina sp. YC-516-91]|uniref:pilus assembly FimT family protein n=1 Tax=Pseudidiomarina salilacus TaxID=3384452 RepID=UPI003984B291